LRHDRITGQRKLIAIAALVALAPLAGASAQRQTAAPVPHLMVTTFAAPEPGFGVQAAEAVRQRIAKDADEKKLLVIPKKDIDATLTASGYSTTEALQPNDARALAVLLRADEYVEGTATKTPTGVKVDARLVLARDNTIQQPLPSAEGPRLDAVAQMISKNYQAARAQLESERACNTLFRDGKYKEAEQAARAGLTKYPTGTIVGICLANALDKQNQTDSVLAVVQRILAVDPRNISALKYAADIYNTRKDPKELDALTALMAADPTNEAVRTAVVNQMAASGPAGAAHAVPLIQEALKNNPGDPKLLRMAWLVFLAAKQYDLAFQTGAELIKADTAAADSSYFTRTAAAYATQNNLPKAIETLKAGEAKYPNGATLYLTEASVQNKAGNQAAALAAAQHAILINPKIENGCLQVVIIQGAMSQPDAEMATARTCATNGGDKHTLGQLMLSEGNKLYKAGNTSKDRPTLQRAIQFLQLSDQLEASSDAKFLVGVSAFTIGQSAITEAQGSKSCTLARMAKDNFAMAQENVPAGLQSYQDAAKQILTAIPQYTPATDEMVKRFCK
jgi:tetratricopeptide (TPR) repeat protein